MAVTILGAVVLAVASAVAAAQQVSFEGQKRLLGAMAANDLMFELVTLPYGDIKKQDGATQAPGEMITADGAPYPDTFWALGRSVSIIEEIILQPELGTSIRGLRVIVRVADDLGVELMAIETFVPEPAA